MKGILKKLNKFLIIILMITIAQSCVTAGKKFDPGLLNLLTPGKSSVDDAIALFGKPTSESYYPDGSRLLQWIYSQGSLFGGKAAHVAILFDSNDIMIRVTHKSEVSVH
jgi:hypothetical protein